MIYLTRTRSFDQAGHRTWETRVSSHSTAKREGLLCPATCKLSFPCSPHQTSVAAILAVLRRHTQGDRSIFGAVCARSIIWRLLLWALLTLSTSCERSSDIRTRTAAHYLKRCKITTLSRPVDGIFQFDCVKSVAAQVLRSDLKVVRTEHHRPSRPRI